jgi:hypothetical protein
MSPLTKTVETLLSRKIRLNSAAGKLGKELLSGNSGATLNKAVRKMGSLVKFQSQKDNQGGFLGFLKQGVKLVGFLFNLAGSLVSFTFTNLFQGFITTVQQLSTVNWNATDEELKAWIEGTQVTSASMWGSVAGQTVGWLVGVAIGAGVAYYLPVIGGAKLAKLIAGKTLNEAKEEILPSLLGAIRQQMVIANTNNIVTRYMQLRSWIKRIPRDKVEAIFGKRVADAIGAWGAKGSPRFTIGEKIEETIEKIPDKRVKAFVESFTEELFDSFVEAGFVVAAELDNVVTQARMANAQALGSQRSVEVVLDNTADDASKEKLQLTRLPQSLMIASVEQQINNFRVMRNRDIGLILGTPVEEYTKAKPQSLRIVIDLYSVKQPPFFKSTQDFTWATVTIPDVKRSALDWNVIKAAVGGENGYLWGRFRAVASLSTGRRLVVHGGSESEVESLVTRLLTLTDARLLTLNITEEKKVGERAAKKKLQKETRRVYPGYFTVLNREEMLEPTEGRASARQKNYRDANARIPLYFKEAPANADDLIRRVLTKGL